MQKFFTRSGPSLEQGTLEGHSPSQPRILDSISAASYRTQVRAPSSSTHTRKSGCSIARDGDQSGRGDGRLRQDRIRCYLLVPRSSQRSSKVRLVASDHFYVDEAGVPHTRIRRSQRESRLCEHRLRNHARRPRPLPSLKTKQLLVSFRNFSNFALMLRSIGSCSSKCQIIDRWIIGPTLGLASFPPCVPTAAAPAD